MSNPSLGGLGRDDVEMIIHRALGYCSRTNHSIFPDYAREFSFLVNCDYASGLTNINNKTPGIASGRLSLVEQFAVAKSQVFAIR
jgi:hypothetical protein